MQTQTLNKNVRLLLISLYIGIIATGLNALVLWPISYIWPYVPVVTFSPLPVAIVVATLLAYWVEEVIRMSSYSRRNKIVLACVVMLVIVAAGIALTSYEQYTVMQHLNQLYGR